MIMGLLLPSQRNRSERDTAVPQAWEKDKRFRKAKEIPVRVRAGEAVRLELTEPGGVILDVPEETQPGEVEFVALRDQFSKTFPKDPEGAVAQLRQDVFSGSSPQAAAEVLLPYLVKASYAQRNLVFNALMEFATPQDILDAALQINERARNPRVLRIAAGLLEHFGIEAVPVLTELARSGRPECRYFVGTIIDLPGAPEEQKREAITALTGHPDAETRQELLDQADRASYRDAALAWRLLANDTDESIREAARERLAELET